MQPLLKIMAAANLAAMGALWFWGLGFFGRVPTESRASTFLLLVLGAVILCGTAWALRNARLRASGRGSSIDPRLIRDRAIGAGAAVALFFVFSLALDRVGDQPHSNLAAAAAFAAWFAIGIVSLIICAICLAGGGKR